MFVRLAHSTSLMYHSLGATANSTIGRHGSNGQGAEGRGNPREESGEESEGIGMTFSRTPSPGCLCCSLPFPPVCYVFALVLSCSLSFLVLIHSLVAHRLVVVLIPRALWEELGTWEPEYCAKTLGEALREGAIRDSGLGILALTCPFSLQ